jgi:hypothetical protein
MYLYRVLCRGCVGMSVEEALYFLVEQHGGQPCSLPLKIQANNIKSIHADYIPGRNLFIISFGNLFALSFFK